MTVFKRIASLMLIFVLAACGGGGGSAGTSTFGPPSAASAPLGVPVASRLVLTLSATSLLNTGAGNVTATATATTAGGQVVGSVPVTFSVDNNAVFSVSGAATKEDGQATATVSIGADKSSRVVTVTAVSGSLTASASFNVTGAKLTGTASPAVVLPGSAGNVVTFRLVDANAAAIVGQAISIEAGSLGTTRNITGSNGDFTYAYTAPATVGTLDVVARAGGTTSTQTVQIQSSGSNTIPAVTAAILSASVSANPSVVSTNTGSTSNRTEIRALFVGENNTPVKNVRVRFDLAGDTASVGGTFSTGDNIVYADDNGVATSAYLPGTRSSPTNGVTIRACYGPTDFSSCTTAPFSTVTTITVVSEPLAVTIGGNEAVYTGDINLTYQRRFVVQVVDASGAAKENVQITASVDLDRYYKGEYNRGGGAWVTSYIDSSAVPPVIVPLPAVACYNEDINRNGTLEVAEDLNHNGSLEPRKSDVAVSFSGSSRTNSSGAAVVQIEYPKNLGTWARVKILVTANGVAGTEGRATWTEVLAVPASVLTESGVPAFVNSPYGRAVRVANGVLYPDVPGGSDVSHDNVAPCNNPN